MIRGLYAAASSMLATLTRQEQTANNLANLNTPGFKRDSMPIRNGPTIGEVRPVEGLFAVPYPVQTPILAIGVVGTGALNDPVITDFSDGDVRETGEELDLALAGPGFFEMRAGDGAVFYSRSGQFSRDAGGRLVDANGALVLGDEGPIVVGQGRVSIDPDGTVFSEGEEVGILRIVEFETDTPMRKLGSNGFRPADPDARLMLSEGGTIVQQGTLELSNVDPTRATADMMSAMRSYEAAQRLVQMNDTILERAVNDIGRV